MVIFIDDLDRSAPPKPVEIIEAINVLLDFAHCVFVLGMDSQAVAKSIEAKYKDLMDDAANTYGSEPTLGRAFLEKIVQIFVVPRADPEVFRGFVNKNLEVGEQQEAAAEEDRENVVQAEMLIEEHQRRGKSLDEAAKSVQAESDVPKAAVVEAKVELRARSFGDSEEVRQAVADAVPYLGYNPRKIKRFINLFKLQALIANRRGLVDDGTIQFEHLAKWVIISTRWPAVVDSVMSDPDFIERLVQAHEMLNEVQAIEDSTAREEASRSKLEPMLVDPRVRQLYRADELIRLLKDLSSSGVEMSSYLYLTRVNLTRIIRSNF
jgi:hypothetical protein